MNNINFNSLTFKNLNNGNPFSTMVTNNSTQIQPFTFGSATNQSVVRHEPLASPISLDLLKLSKAEILAIITTKRDLCFKELLGVDKGNPTHTCSRFDLKDLNIYAHQQYDNQINTVVKRQQQNINGLKENKQLATWINKIGGRIKFQINDQVNIVIAEEFKIASIIEEFLIWKVQVLIEISNQNSSFLQKNTNTDQAALILRPLKVVAKNKREQMLLGAQPKQFQLINSQNQQHIGQSSAKGHLYRSVSAVKISENDQKLVPGQQITLEQAFNSKLRLGNNSSHSLSFEDTLQRTSSQEELLAKLLKNESDQSQRDFQLLSLLLTQPLLMLADIELMYTVIQKYYYFSTEYHKRRKIPVADPLLPLTFALTYKYRPETLQRSHTFQNYHTFDQKLYHPASTHSTNKFPPFYPSSTINPSQNHQAPQAIALVPLFRANAPLGSSFFLDYQEYKSVMKDRDLKEAQYKKHLEKLDKKKPELYDLQTPIPAHPDRCFVCEDKITQGYKEHLKSQQHLDNIQNNYLYAEIDNVIEELQEELIMKEKQQKGRRKRQGKGVGRGGEFQSSSSGERIDENGGQELTNMNYFSTEVTLANKEQLHRKKQRLPQAYLGLPNGAASLNTLGGNLNQHTVNNIKPSLEHRRLHQSITIQQIQVQNQVNQKRKRFQALEEEKEEQQVKFTIYNTLKEDQQVEIEQQPRVYFHAKRTNNNVAQGGTKTRQQKKMDQLENQQQIQKQC